MTCDCKPFDGFRIILIPFCASVSILRERARSYASVYDVAQDKPFDVAQDRPFDVAQDRRR
jgi:hypothetical protein